jgi:uncharacterized membrane protein
VDFEVNEEKALKIYLLETPDKKIKENIKTFGGSGGVLLLIAGFFSPIPHIGAAISLLASVVGFILMAIAIKQLSEFKKDEKAFKNFIIATVLYFVNSFLFLFLILGIIAIMAGSDNSSDEMTSALVFVSITGIVLYVLGIVSSLFFKKCFNSLSKITNKKMFSTGGNLIFIGSFLTIILVGFIIILIGWIFVTVGFFSLNSNN